MPWQIVKRKIGRAGSEKQRAARQREWDREYGADNWAIGYRIEGEFVLQESALESIYDRSYAAHFEAHPADLTELIQLARLLRNPHAEATTGVDLQVPAIMKHLASLGRSLEGTEIVDIGTWQGMRSHAISVRLSPLHIRCVIDPKRTLEEWWQTEKCLAIWVESS